MMNIFSHRKRLENSVLELQKNVQALQEVVNALAKSRSEERAPFSQILDEWQNGKEEQNG